MKQCDKNEIQEIFGNSWPSHLADMDNYTNRSDIVENLADGIDKTKFKNIFKKFVSCKESTREAGCGIGLAICREIAKMDGGNIKAKMEKFHNEADDKLSKITFEMTLPNKKHSKSSKCL